VSGGEVSTAKFWEGLYRDKQDGWDLGRAAPPLERFVAAHRALVDGKRVLVVGCGRGHDARMLVRAGGHVTAIDFAQDAVDEARRIAQAEGVALDVQQADLFELRGQYDLVVEHTCFCAIDPTRRAEYVDTVARLVAPGGALLALFYAHNREGGPPFGTTDAELDQLFLTKFSVEHRETPPDSLERRSGDERLLLLKGR
jgi:cyclopropane fatty-acyl-phospholipid synthase-like methyltransferase